jgi:TP901 family phage tail tape measure protein
MARVTKWGLNIWVRLTDYASRAFALLTGSIKLTGEEADKLRAELKALSKDAKLATASAMAFSYSAFKLGGFLLQAAETAGKTEYQLKMLEGILGKADESFKKLSAAIKLNTERLVEWRPEEKAKVAVELARAGLSAQEALGVLPVVLDLMTAGQLQSVKATRLITHTMRAFGLTVDEAREMASKLAWVALKTPADFEFLVHAMGFATRAAALTNESLEEMMILLGLLAPIMRTGSKAGTALANALVRLYGMQEKIRKSAKLALIPLRDTEGRYKSILQLALELSERFKKVGLAMKMKTAKIALGMRGMAALTAIERAAAAGGKEFGDKMVYGAKAVAILRQNIDEAGDFLAKLAEKMRESYVIQKKMLTASLEEFETLIGEKAIPKLRLLIDALLKAMKSGKEVEKGTEGMISTFISQGLILGSLILGYKAVTKMADVYRVGSAALTKQAGKLGVNLASTSAAATALGHTFLWGKSASKLVTEELTRSSKTLLGFDKSAILASKHVDGLVTGLRAIKTLGAAAAITALLDLDVIMNKNIETSAKLKRLADDLAVAFMILGGKLGLAAGAAYFFFSRIKWLHHEISSLLLSTRELTIRTKEYQEAGLLISKVYAELIHRGHLSQTALEMLRSEQGRTLASLIALAHQYEKVLGAQEARERLLRHLERFEPFYRFQLKRTKEELLGMTFTLLGALRVQGRQVKVVDEAGEAVQDFESRLEAALTPLRFAREELELASEAWEKLPWWKKLYIPPPGVVPGLERVEVPRPPAEEVRFEINLQLADETMAKAIMRYFTDTRELTFEEAENMSLPRSQVRR